MLQRRISRRNAIKAGGLAALGLVLGKALISEGIPLYPKEERMISVTMGYEGYTFGTLRPSSIQLPKGSTVLDAMLDSGPTVITQSFPNGRFLHGIGFLENGIYRINGKWVDVAVDQYVLQNGDAIVWSPALTQDGDAIIWSPGSA